MRASLVAPRGCDGGGGVAPRLSLAAGYCAVAKRNGKQPATAKAEPYASPPFTERAPFGPAGRRRSLEVWRNDNASRFPCH